MKKNIRPTFFALPLGISDLKFKNNNSTIIMLGRLYCLWYKRKQNIRIRKKVLKEELFWFSDLSIKRALQELEAQNIIVIDHDVYKEERVYEIKFTDFFKNKISNYSEAKSNVVDYDNEDIDEINPEDIEEQEEVDCENLNAEKTTTKEVTTEDYNPDDYLPVEGWRNTDRQDFRCILRKYDGKVPEVPEEVLNFDFGKIKREDYQVLEMLEEASNFDYSKLKPSDFLPNDFITNDGIFCDRTYTNDDNTKFGLYPFFSNDDNSPMTIKQLIELKKKGDLNLEIWKDFKKYFIPEWENLKAKGLV